MRSPSRRNAEKGCTRSSINIERVGEYPPRGRPESSGGTTQWTPTYGAGRGRNCGITYQLKGCAVSRTMVSLAQPGGTERRVLGSPAYFHSERGEGTAACRERGGQPKTCRLTHCKTRTIRVRLDCLKPNLRSGRLVPHRYHVWKRCYDVRWYSLSTSATSPS